MLTESSTGLQHSSDNFGESIFSKMIKAGHRTYFLDVKETRNKDYFMTITELRKKTTDKKTTDNGVENERNKIFLYQEDFEKFAKGFNDALDFVKRSMAQDKKEF